MLFDSVFRYHYCFSFPHIYFIKFQYSSVYVLFHSTLNVRAKNFHILIVKCFWFFFCLFPSPFRSIVSSIVDRIDGHINWIGLGTSARKRPQKSDYGITWNSYSAGVGVNMADVIHVGERNSRAANSTSQM